MANEVKIVCTPGRERMLANTGPQVGYVLIEAIPVGAGAAVRLPLNLSLVLDRSGSMAGEKIEHLREAVKLILDRLEAQDVVSIILFDDRADILVPAQPAADKENLKRLVDGITDRGGTEMSKGMKLSITELQKHLSKDRVSGMMVLTDGQTYGDEKDCVEIAGQCQQEGIRLWMFGLGEDWNEDLLDDIAKASGPNGVWAFIEQPSAILMHFTEAHQSMTGVVAKNAFLTLRLVQGVAPRQVWRVFPIIANLGYQPLSDRDVQVMLGDLERDKGQSVLVELTVPTRQPGKFRLAQAEVTYDVPHEGKMGEKVKADCIVEFTTDEAATKQVNAKVMNFAEKATAFKLQTRALDAARAGDVGTATRLLRQSATRLLSMGEQELAKVAEQEAQRLEQGQQMTSMGTKRLRYETQRLTRPLPKEEE